VLVSIACAYLKMPEVWLIGDEFTHPNHGGRGYAKTAVASGAKALLHVREDNKPAIKVYEALGYKEISRKQWIFIN